MFPVDERVLPGEAPADYVLRVARDKALEVMRQDASDLPVLAADTAVVIDGEILGKPDGPVEAAAMLARLSGRVPSRVTMRQKLSAAGGMDAVHPAIGAVRREPAVLELCYVDRITNTAHILVHGQ